MTRLALRAHPESGSSVIRQVAVETSRPHTDRLDLLYLATGRIEDIRLPPPTTPMRADELWRTTCFEAFIGSMAHPAYYEFNFSPSTQWAAYRFSGYRKEMARAMEAHAPSIASRAGTDVFELRVELELKGVFDALGAPPWQFGLSAVIEDSSGAKSYWALKHPPGKPDFHHADSFAIELPPAERP